MNSTTLKKHFFKRIHLIAVKSEWNLVALDFLLLNSHGLVGLAQVVGVLLVGSGLKGFLLPQVRGQVAVGLGDGVEGCLCEVSEGGGLSAGAGVAILQTGHTQELLGHG